MPGQIEGLVLYVYSPAWQQGSQRLAASVVAMVMMVVVVVVVVVVVAVNW